MQYERRMLYIPVFHVDTTVIDTRGALPVIDHLEKWAKNNVIRVNVSKMALNNIPQCHDDLSKVFTVVDESINEFDPIFRKVASIVFPSGVKNKSHKNIVKIVCEAIKQKAIYVIYDDGSKKRPGGILGNAHGLSKLVQVMQASDVIEFINKKIIERDSNNKNIAEIAFKPLPEWTGKDHVLIEDYNRLINGYQNLE